MLSFAPYVQNIQIELMDNTDGTNDTSKLFLKNGISFAKNDRMEKACELWHNSICIFCTYGAISSLKLYKILLKALSYNSPSDCG